MLRISLPDLLPVGGCHVCLAMTGLPEESYIVKAYLNPAGQAEPASHLATSFAIYGRGLGSRAKEKPRILVPLEPSLLARAGKPRGNVLVLRIETPGGDPVAPDLQFLPPTIEPL